MKQTEVIRDLVNELKRASVISLNKEFLELIGLPTDSVHIKRLSAYLHRGGDIRDSEFLVAVEKKFGFDSSIWNDNNYHQKLLIQKSVSRLIQESNGSYVIDLDRIIVPNYSLTHEQKRLLRDFESVKRKDIESMIDNFLNLGLLDKRLENQEFLVALIKIAYVKGLYAIIANLLLPNLIISYRQRVDIQKIEAHTLGSLGNYDEAKYILKQLIHENTIENINLKTSALSNHKRAILNQKEIDQDGLYLLVEGYKSLFEYDEIYSYYTGINLLYMVMLGRLLFKDDGRFFNIDADEIYKKSKESLKSDKTHELYYNVMSDFEFQMMLNYPDILPKIESFLDLEQPNPTFVERTIRQMRLFVSKVEDKDNPIIKEFKKCIELLSNYVEYIEQVNL